MAEAPRRTEAIFLRLLPRDAKRLRALRLAARRIDGRVPTLGEYVMALADGEPLQPARSVDLREFAEVPRSLAALLEAPRAIRELEADLGRLTGQLRQLWNDDRALAEAHRPAIDANQRGLRDLMARVGDALAESERACAPARDELRRIAATVRRRLDVA
ncbi:MAG: hypothetical protein ACREQ5_28175 [Candidatus Dormibacteria bacterium]